MADGDTWLSAAAFPRKGGALGTTAGRRTSKTVGPLNRYWWWKRQDGAIRQQVIEQLMRQIMHYDVEFRREEAISAVSSHAKHRPRFGSTGALGQFDPLPTLDQGCLPWRCKRSFPVLRGSDFRSLKVFLGV